MDVRHAALDLCLVVIALARGAGAAERIVWTNDELKAAVESVEPGDTVILGPGRYGSLHCARSGTEDRKIVFRRMRPDEYERVRGKLLTVADHRGLTTKPRLVRGHAVLFAPAPGREGAVKGGAIEGTRADDRTEGYEVLHTIGEARSGWNLVALEQDPAGYRFLRYRGKAASLGYIAELEFYSNGKRIKGLPFGDNSFNAGGDPRADYPKAFDDNVQTYFEGHDRKREHVVGVEVVSDKTYATGCRVRRGSAVRLYPRPGDKRDIVVGGVIQASNSDPFDGPFTTLLTIPGPLGDGWNEFPVQADLRRYRYLRFQSIGRRQAGMAELEFVHDGRRIVGVPFGTTGAEPGWGPEKAYTAVFDGDTETCWKPAHSWHVFAGIDTDLERWSEKPALDPHVRIDPFTVELQGVGANGRHIVFDGFTVWKGGPGGWGQHVRFTNCTFEGMGGGGWVFPTAHDFEIDHCEFRGMYLSRREKRGVFVKIFNSGRTWPARHVIHHNDFHDTPHGIKGNGYETIQVFGGEPYMVAAEKNTGGVYYKCGEDARCDGQSRLLVALNRFEHCDGEPEMISLKWSGNFLLLNTCIENQGRFVKRGGHGDAFEGNYFFRAGIRTQGGEHIIRNNYFQESRLSVHMGGRMYSTARDVRFVNNTFVDHKHPFDLPGEEGRDTSPQRPVVANNLAAARRADMKGRASMLGGREKLANWIMMRNFSVACALEPEVRASRARLAAEEVEGSPFVLFRPEAGSELSGAAGETPFGGGLDPLGNIVPRRGVDVGALQRGPGRRMPLQHEDVGPFKQKGERPVVRIVSPEADAELAGEVGVRVDAHDPDGEVRYVYLSHNGLPVSVDAAAPYEWRVRIGRSGHNFLRAVAFDDRDNLGYHSVHVLGPVEPPAPRER
ncbi:MAG: chondroitinase-B domain-containing protein [Planctomycetota bacterium]|jgi:hypothetical protein